MAYFVEFTNNSNQRPFIPVTLSYTIVLLNENREVLTRTFTPFVGPKRHITTIIPNNRSKEVHSIKLIIESTQPPILKSSLKLRFFGQDIEVNLHSFPLGRTVLG